MYAWKSRLHILVKVSLPGEEKKDAMNIQTQIKGMKRKSLNTYTVFLSCRMSLLLNSLRISRKGRFGG